MNEPARSARPIAISGELNIYTAGELRDRLINESGGIDDIELDLAEVSEIDSAGLQLLIALSRQLSGEGRQFRIGQCHPAVREAIAFSRQTALFGEENNEGRPS
jgi:anti-sigma B factor antagonist